MRMVGECRATGVEYREHADACAEVLGSAAMVIRVSAEALDRMS